MIVNVLPRPYSESTDNVPAMPVNDGGVHHGKALAGFFSHRLRGKERIEYMVDKIIWNSSSGIGDCYKNAVQAMARRYGD